MRRENSGSNSVASSPHGLSSKIFSCRSCKQFYLPHALPTPEYSWATVRLPTHSSGLVGAPLTAWGGASLQAKSAAFLACIEATPEEADPNQVRLMRGQVQGLCLLGRPGYGRIINNGDHGGGRGGCYVRCNLFCPAAECVLAVPGIVRTGSTD